VIKVASTLRSAVSTFQVCQTLAQAKFVLA
jgi:hypothetical protein